MGLVNPESLNATLDALDEAFFTGWRQSKADRVEAATWIADRQGLPGSYAGMFAPTAEDFRTGVRFFTGERMPTRAGTAHVLGEEACRALILLDVKEAAVRDALRRATDGIMKRVAKVSESGCGTYCCGKCTVAYWRHLAVGGLDHAERRLAAGMKVLKSRRHGAGRWRIFPFYYTLLALSEIDLPSSRNELRYAAPVCERLLRGEPKDNRFDSRRRRLAENVLAAC
jgi:hypothetical protein